MIRSKEDELPVEELLRQIPLEELIGEAGAKRARGPSLAWVSALAAALIGIASWYMYTRPAPPIRAVAVAVGTSAEVHHELLNLAPDWSPDGNSLQEPSEAPLFPSVEEYMTLVRSIEKERLDAALAKPEGEPVKVGRFVVYFEVERDCTAVCVLLPNGRSGDLLWPRSDDAPQRFEPGLHVLPGPTLAPTGSTRFGERIHFDSGFNLPTDTRGGQVILGLSDEIVSGETLDALRSHVSAEAGTDEDRSEAALAWLRERGFRTIAIPLVEKVE
ncbi:MAG: hypothetical protein GY711_17300 [bacterium]|nr:hypothetical protein [bacterium]